MAASVDQTNKSITTDLLAELINATTAICTEIIDVFGAPVPSTSQVEKPQFDEPKSEKSTAPSSRSKKSMMKKGMQFNEPQDNIGEEYFRAIKIASGLPKSVLLETFNPSHMRCAEVLINVFYKMKLQNFPNAFQYAKANVNTHLLDYAISVVLRHRNDTNQANIHIPSHINTDPKMYINMTQANQQYYEQQFKKSSNSKPVLIIINPNFTATDQDLEHRIAYFREDIAVNLHHRHWHEVYPFVGVEAIVNKDRVGELFYYMHQQILARYNFERLCNNLPQVVPFSNLREPIREAYFPKLDSEAKAKLWCPRQANTYLQDLDRDTVSCSISNMERWRERIYEAIDRGYAYVKNSDGTETLKKLVEPDAINDLGNTIQSIRSLSLNSDYYGDLHNNGHLFISYCHDPDYRFREQGSVMSHSETALRDPMFYRWHAFIDEIFQQYKATLKPYSLEKRQFSGIKIEAVAIESQKLPKNTLQTYWQEDVVDITQGILGLDASKNGVFAQFTHLQHTDFTYNITVTNEKSTEMIGTVRIFIAPKYGESGQPMSFNKQRRMFIELDKFTTTLQPGNNEIKRESTKSSVTIPFEQSFMTADDAKKFTKDEGQRKNLLSYCGCGWPQHMLIGKGTVAGFPCDLFVMITDYEKDKVESDSMNGTGSCGKSAVSYCGIRDKKYPDRRPMGFPFDRNVADSNATLADFLTKSQIHAGEQDQTSTPKKEEPLPNMKVIDVEIKFRDTKPVQGPSISKCDFCNA